MIVHCVRCKHNNTDIKATCYNTCAPDYSVCVTIMVTLLYNYAMILSHMYIAWPSVLYFLSSEMLLLHFCMFLPCILYCHYNHTTFNRGKSDKIIVLLLS